MSETNAITFIKSYWDYYLELEEQLISTRRFVDFDKANHETFSIEYLKLLQATCSEIDVVGKMIAEEMNPAFKKTKSKNIQKWGFYVQRKFAHIELCKVQFNKSEELEPWNKWAYEKYVNANKQQRYRLQKGKETPSWWTAYNKVKHERTSTYNTNQINYARANLGNLIHAMAALYILEKLYITNLCQKNNYTIDHQESRLFLPSSH